jgi:hypothetical protein
MVWFNFTTVALEEGLTFVFGSWVCVPNSAGDFRRHLVDTKKPEAFARTSRRDIDDLIEDLDKIQRSDLIKTLTISTTWLDFSLHRNVDMPLPTIYYVSRLETSRGWLPHDRQLVSRLRLDGLINKSPMNQAE